MNSAQVPLILSADWAGYQLLDSGDRRKLERFGPVTIIRGESKAWWRPDDPSRWAGADAVLRDDGRWDLRRGVARNWVMELEGLKLQARLTDGSRHLGVFPEQEPNWSWMAERLRTRQKPRLLNLFGYTGVASLIAARAGAQVTHVDASKPSIAWGRENQHLSGMGAAPVRWVLEDALKYVGRELRRGSRYEAILLDPPSFGRGPNGEVWRVEEQVVELLSLCRGLLSDTPLLLILTLYNLEASSLMLENLVGDVLRGLGGELCVGELALKHERSAKRLPLSLFARWQGAGSSMS
ncbi:MAG: class I SAM-dependent methyltransferase [Opitutales bacterium]|jgi:23S rRNA (cytosine1962-C5)-methyltransferase